MLQPQDQLGWYQSVAPSTVAPKVCDGQVPLGVWATLRNRNQMIERQLRARHLPFANVAAHAVAFRNPRQVDGFDAISSFARPSTSLRVPVLPSNTVDVTGDPRPHQRSMTFPILSIPRVVSFGVTLVGGATRLFDLLAMRFVPLVFGACESCGIALLPRLRALQNMRAIVNVAPATRVVHAKYAGVASAVGVLGIPARCVELVEWLGDAADATRLHASIVHMSVTGQVTA
jgi:hypothetical protein